MSRQQRAGAARVRGLVRLITLQALVVLAAAGTAAALAGRDAAAAAAAGGLICLVPHAWFAARLLAADPGDPGAVVRALYAGEGVKLAAIAIAMVALFRAWPDVPPLPLILSFIAVQAVHWLTPLLLEG